MHMTKCVSLYLHDRNVSLATRSGIWRVSFSSFYQPRLSVQVSDFETERKENDIEDIYFDDVLSSDLMKEKHMRLQSTLPLDSTTMSQSTFSDLMRSPMLGPASTSRNTSKNTSYDPLLSISGLDEANISQRKARKDMKIRTSKSYGTLSY